MVQIERKFIDEAFQIISLSVLNLQKSRFHEFWQIAIAIAPHWRRLNCGLITTLTSAKNDDYSVTKEICSERCVAKSVTTPCTRCYLTLHLKRKYSRPQAVTSANHAYWAVYVCRWWGFHTFLTSQQANLEVLPNIPQQGDLINSNRRCLAFTCWKKQDWTCDNQLFAYWANIMVSRWFAPI